MFGAIYVSVWGGNEVIGVCDDQFCGFVYKYFTCSYTLTFCLLKRCCFVHEIPDCWWMYPVFQFWRLPCDKLHSMKKRFPPIQTDEILFQTFLLKDQNTWESIAFLCNKNMWKNGAMVITPPRNIDLTKKAKRSAYVIVCRVQNEGYSSITMA